MFIAVLWLLDRESSDSILTSCLGRINQLFYSLRSKFLYFVLLVQLFCSITPVTADLFYPFSAGLQAASWIKDSGRENWFIVGHSNYAITPVVGYLNKKLYALEFDKIWVNPDQYGLSEYEERTPVPILFSKLPRLKDTYGKEILFVFNFPVEEKLLDTYQLVEVARFDNAILEDERFYIYIFKEAQ